MNATAPKLPMTHPLKPLLRLIGWVGFGLILIISLVPGSERPHTGMPGHLEHCIAYFMTATAYSCGCSRLRERLTWLAFLSAASGVFEAVQLVIPGRSGQVIDWAASSFGAGIGTLFGWLLWTLVNQTFKQRSPA
jgi:VanZ family protein